MLWAGILVLAASEIGNKFDFSNIPEPEGKITRSLDKKHIHDLPQNGIDVEKGSG
jgi:hypothetical protein